MLLRTKPLFSKNAFGIKSGFIHLPLVICVGAVTASIGTSALVRGWHTKNIIELRSPLYIANQKFYLKQTSETNDLQAPQIKSIEVTKPKRMARYQDRFALTEMLREELGLAKRVRHIQVISAAEKRVSSANGLTEEPPPQVSSIENKQSMVQQLVSVELAKDVAVMQVKQDSQLALVDTQVSQGQAQLPPGTLGAPPGAEGESSVDTAEKELEKIKAALKSQPTFSGKVLEAFSAQPIEGCSVEILGTSMSIQTNKEGFFEYSGISIEGVLPVIISKDGYLNRRVDIQTNQHIQVELVSKNTEILSALAAQKNLNDGAGFVLGELDISGTKNGLGVEVHTQDGLVDIVYLDDNGLPNLALNKTSAKGQFLIINAKPGDYLLALVDVLGQEKAPHFFHISPNEGIVRKFGSGELRMIKGQLFNAEKDTLAIDSAKIQLLGSSQIVQTDALGKFELGPVYVDCDSQNYLQIEKKDFYRNRIEYKCEERQGRKKYFVFTPETIDRISAEAGQPLEPGTAIVLGHIKSKAKEKTQLWGAEEMGESINARGVDFYFGSSGQVDRSKTHSGSNGNFVILNAPQGFSYLQGFKADKRMSFSWPIFTSTDTINVYIQ